MFEAAGTEAVRVLDLFWPLLAGAVVIWLLVVGGGLYAVRRPPAAGGERLGNRLILLGGVVVPTLLLAVLAVVGLRLMVELRAPAGEARIRVSGEQFWWRVEYLAPDGSVRLESANELRLPRGRATELELVTADVIHSFWVPALAGKMDMVPGRVNRLVVEPERPGTFRGQCAEFCGASHALMAFTVRVMEPAPYAAWIERRRQPAAPPATPAERHGQRLFLGYGCGACHRVRGTPADGRIGPDLTHFARRGRLAAHTLPNEPAAVRAWLRRPSHVKPGVRMPAFDMLAEGELAAIATYLGSLQ